MSDGVAGLRDALRERYTIESELGRGGMATVYVARDLKHKRDRRPQGPRSRAGRGAHTTQLARKVQTILLTSNLQAVAGRCS